jgi:hypothetical protein
MKKMIYGMVALLGAPVFVLAQGTNPAVSTLTNLANGAASIVTILLPVAASLAVLFFFWSLAMFILSSGSAEKGKNKTQMLWGVVAIFVIFSIWGLVGFLRSTFGIDDDATMAAPSITMTTVEHSVV